MPNPSRPAHRSPLAPQPLRSTAPRAATRPATLTRRKVLAGAGTVLAAPLLAGPRPVGARQDASEVSGQLVKAIYFNPLVSTDNADFLRLLDLIERTELNALVVDVKEDGGVYYPTEVPLFRDAGTFAPVLDVEGVVAALRQRGIRSIARLVTFKDSGLAWARPDLAVIDDGTGDPWLDYGDGSWLNPFAPEVQTETIALAEELAGLGFDEIQFDYVRFPSDGDLERVDYGQAASDVLKIETIASFLGDAQQSLAARQVTTAADVFGFTLLQDDIGIGQNLRALAPVCDVLCPMTYPSHYPEGSIDVPGHPNDFPAETLAQSLEAGRERVADNLGLLRPWLQDFTLPGMSPYGAADVRAQIDATEAAGAGGWMIWDASNEYSTEAFRLAE